MKYIVYAVYFGETVERYYIGFYNSSEVNEVIAQMNRFIGNNIRFCMCKKEDAKSLEIKYLPF